MATLGQLHIKILILKLLEKNACLIFCVPSGVSRHCVSLFIIIIIIVIYYLTILLHHSVL